MAATGTETAMESCDVRILGFEHTHQARRGKGQMKMGSWFAVGVEEVAEGYTPVGSYNAMEYQPCQQRVQG